MLEPLVPYKVSSLTPLRVNCPEKTLLKDCETKSVTFGSCFAQYSALSLQELGFDSYYNPHNCFHYSSSSILQLLNISFSDDTSIQQGIAWCSQKKKYFSLYHRDLVGDTIDAVQDKMRNVVSELRVNLSDASLAILTIGSATYQRHKKTNQVVCHGNGLKKEEYVLETESCDDISRNLEKICKLLKQNMKEGAEIVITISPQRYSWSFAQSETLDAGSFYDQLYSNQNWLVYSNYEKARIRVGLFDYLAKLTSEDRILYFPSFDIVIDELRNHDSMHQDFEDYLHVDLPKTAHYVINRFLNLYTSEPLKEYLRFYRKCFHANSAGLLTKYRKLNVHDKEEFLERVFSQALKYCDTVKATATLTKLYSLFKQHQGFTNHPLYSSVCDRVIESGLLNEPRLMREASKVSAGESVVIYGLGINFDKAYEMLGDKIKVVVDKQWRKFNSVYGYKVMSPDSLSEQKIDKVFICSESGYKEIRQELLDMGISDAQII